MPTDLFDCHTHTEFSSCAEDVTLAGYAQRARAGAGFAITDHSAQIYYPPDNRWGFWSEQAYELFAASEEGGRQRIAHYIDTCRAAQCGRMLVGTELDVLPDGRMVFPADLLGTLDLVVGAVHSMPTLRAKRPLAEILAEFRFQVEALAGHGMQALVHPYRLLLAAEVPVDDELIRWTVATAADAGFALEINSHKQFPDHDLTMVRLALEAGVPIAIGTDTHRWSEFGDFSYHERILESAGLSGASRARCLWPTAPVDLSQAAAGQ